MHEKGCNYLIQYLRARTKAGEELSGGSPAIRADTEHKVASLKSRGVKPSTFFICSANISAEVRRAIRRAGYGWRPYVLRSYFDSHLMTAEFQGRISGESRSWFMGHRGSIERRYTLNKKRLPTELFNMMRDQYQKGAAFLVAEELTNEQVETKIEEVRSDLRIKAQEEVRDELSVLKENFTLISARSTIS